jgi:hypothetical protein
MDEIIDGKTLKESKCPKVIFARKHIKDITFIK